VTSESQKPHRRLAGVTAVAAAVAAAGLAVGGAAGASTGPVLQTLTYTATGPGGSLYHPVGVSAADGTVYVSDTGANVVARLAGGSTTTAAGSLSAYGEHGDGGQAASASLYHPGGTAEDARGDVFIADSGDNTVREITAAGVISRLAGTGTAGLGYAGPSGFPAALSSLDHPQNVAVSARGEVFIADTYNNRVVKVTPQGQVTAVAGDGKAGYSGDGRPGAFAELNEPTGVAVDSRGNLYIADSASNVIRRVDARTGIITTVVNSATAGGGTPAAGGETSGAAPAASKLNTPYGVAVDSSTGDLYIADTGNSKIAEVTGLAQPGTAAGPVAPAAS
jgi:DNA-binding beta-propeller fold protein YncE